jgi:hypothetical protein
VGLPGLMAVAEQVAPYLATQAQFFFQLVDPHAIVGGTRLQRGESEPHAEKCHIKVEGDFIFDVCSCGSSCFFSFLLELANG